MSSSTVAVTATPAGTKSPALAMDSSSQPNVRFRVTEKSTNLEMATERALSGVASERVVGGKDLSHSIRGETVIGRPKDPLQAKRVMATSTISPRKRKPVPKTEKPRWQTVLSVFTKNLGLLLVILGLGQLMWKWVGNSADKPVAPIAVTDLEGRISELERLMKTIGKMAQVQIEIADRKLESEMGSVRREFTKKNDEIAMMIENELKKLVSRADYLDKSLTELKESSFLSKEDFDNFFNELKKSKGLEGSDKTSSLDEITAIARQIVEKELEKHAADGLGRVDYALASSGARVVRHSEPFYYEKGASWFPAAKSRTWVHRTAQKMLEPSFGEPGQCFPLKGHRGFVEIRLRTAIIPEAVTLEHVAKNVAYDRSSAPKDCLVFAWFQGLEDDHSSQTAKMFRLVEFTYDLEKSNAQTFNVESSDTGLVNMVRFDFSSNHGSLAHTCIYRLRVHGYEPESVPTLAMQC